MAKSGCTAVCSQTASQSSDLLEMALKPFLFVEIIWLNEHFKRIGVADALTPNLGQGGVLAMEDAMVLASLLPDCGHDLAERLKQHRHQRVSGVQRNSRRLGWFAHADNPLTILIKHSLSCLPKKGVINPQVDRMEQFERVY